jgi:DNA-directed RNA polymerase specialized sigma subunit
VEAPGESPELVGLRKAVARFERKSRRLADELANHIMKNGAMRHEIKKLEGLLVWIHRTEQPIEEIRAVIERTIPRRLARDDDASHVTDV